MPKKKTKTKTKPDLQEILQTNKDKTFVKRILNPSQYPSLDLGGGRFASHLMAWGQVGNKYVVYPTVSYGKGVLTQFSGRDAWEQSKQTGNFIEFNTPEEAAWFSKNYKQFWKPNKRGGR